MAKVTMPQLGESVAEGTIGKWLKSVGDEVALDEPLLEVITDKVNAEVPSPFAGTLREILVQEGQNVPYGVEIAVIEETAGATAPEAGTAAPTPAAKVNVGPEAPTGAATTPAAASIPAAKANVGAEAPTGAATTTAAATPASTSPAATTAEGRVPVMAVGDPDARMTPAVRLMMRKHGLSPMQIVGTGHAGRITREDVTAFVDRGSTGASATGRGAAAAASATAPGPATPTAEAGSPSIQPALAPSLPSHSPGLLSSAPSSSPSSAVVWESDQDEVLVPHTQMRRGIAAQMTRAAAIPAAYSTFEADMTAVVNLRAAQAGAYKAREGVGLSFLPFVVKAVVEALHGHPDLNAHYVEEGLLRKRRVNIGIAIAVENGLIVPVIHDADQLSINGINRAVQDLASRARSNKLRLDDLQGGTFTIDNTGWFGSVLTVPIINAPEVCILTTEAVVKRPVVRETPEGDVLAVRSMMNLVAGYDHRATDGAQIGLFVRDVICWLEAVGADSPIY
ncbi:MAG TPA: dihydrolipoamide acetyltransferase family protein [Terriglobales bacterium]|nr:dihydrolipoamide acetyltransferase family protein [Terriglobales bacterium]